MIIDIYVGLNFLLFINLLLLSMSTSSPLLLLLMLPVAICQIQIGLTSITANNYNIMATSTYTFTISRYTSNQLPLNSQLALTFINNYQINSPSCSSSDFGSSNITCSFLVNKLTVQGLFSQNLYLNPSNFKIEVTGLTNPTPAGNYVPITTVQITNGGTAIEEDSSTLTVQITPRSAVCLPTLSNQLAFNQGQVSISYNSSYIIGQTNSSYTLNIQMDNYYQKDSTQQLIAPTFIPQQQSYQPLGTSSSYTLSYSSTITITMLMPPSTRPLPNFISISAYSNQGLVETCSVSLTGIKPNIFSSLTVTQGTVQTTIPVQFMMKLSVPLMNNDQIKILFPSSFSLNSVTASIISVNTFSFLMIKNNLELSITAVLTNAIYFNPVYITIENITLPPNIAASNILISVLTQDNYYRINQTYSYTSLPGALAVQKTCNNYQLGTTTSCDLQLYTTSSIYPVAAVKIKLPSSFPVITQSLLCSIAGNSLLTSTNCNYNQSTNSIVVGPLTADNSSVITPLNFSINATIVMSRSIGTFTIQLQTLQGESAVDKGSVSITTVTRTLSSSEFSLSSSSSTTYSNTDYTITFSLPFETGFLYIITMHIPVDVQQGQTPASNATILSYINQTLTLSAYLPSITTIQITNLLTPSSTAPTSIAITITYNSQIMFNGSTTITMANLKTFTTLTVAQSNKVVYRPFTATFTISGLEVGDLIYFQASTVNYFFSQDQTNCTTSVVDCTANPLKVLAIDNGGTGLTVLSVGLVNLAYEGSYTLTVTTYNSFQQYGKRKGSVTLQASFLNIISVIGTYNSPSYLLEQSSYHFQLTFTTPNATQLYLSYNGFTSVTATCQLNCNFVSSQTAGITFSLSSMSVTIIVTATNPSLFSNTTVFSFTTMDSSGNSKDNGIFQPQVPCTLPCRSCQDGNSSYCLSCYSWATLKNLNSATCLQSCPSGTYSSQLNALYSCLTCSTGCTVCNPSGCQTCSSTYFIYNNMCYASCPEGTLTVSSNSSCSTCLTPCANCITTTSSCTSCISNSYLLNSTCYFQCPNGYYNPTIGTQCQLCPTTCLTCNSAGCLSCQPSDYFYKGNCYSECPVGSFAESSNCTSCLSSCSSCTSLSVCSACSTGYYLAPNSTCNTFCPTGYYPSSALCLECLTPCLTCNISGCLSCANSSLYLQGQECVSTCSSPKHPNNNTMLCQACISPCSDCTWSDTCLSCISGYSLMGTACLSSCPSGYYSDGSFCLSCPVLCGLCSWANQQVSCSNCLNGSLIFNYDCVEVCPNTTTVSGMYCISDDCSSLDNCLVCSGFRCLQCSNLYEVTSDYTCQKKSNDSPVLQTLAQIPVPFPFLIAIVALVIVAILLKYHFQKMSAPLFLYALAGVPEQLSLFLWATLAMLWNSNVLEPLPLPSSPHATVLIVIVYLFLNVLELILWRSRIVPDRQHRLWERQDNRCSSNLLAFFSLILSYRLNVFRFSRTGHSPRLSARLSSPQVFSHYGVLAVLGMLVNAGMVVVSVYLFSIQQQQNYLFFCCLEVAIIGVLMIVLAIVMLCIPKEQILEDRGQYKYGKDSDQLQGPSLQEALGVEEEYQSQGEVHSGSAVMAKEAPSEDISSEPQGFLSYEGEQFNFSEQDGTMMVNRLNAVKTSKPLETKNEGIDEQSEGGSDSHILVDDTVANKAVVVSLMEQFQLEEVRGAPLVSRHPGIISKQRLSHLPEEESQESSNFGDFKEYTLDYPQKQWKKATGQEKGEGMGLSPESMEPDIGIVNARMVIENDIIAERQKEEREKEEQLKRKEKEAQLEIVRIAKLHSLLKSIQEQEQTLAEFNKHLEQEQVELQRQQQERLREKRERVLMSIEDQLSKANKMFQSMEFLRKTQAHFRKIRKDSSNTPPALNVDLKYSIRDGDNLKGELSPTKIKITPQPEPFQYKLKHLYQEEGVEINSQDQQIEQDQEIVFEDHDSCIVGDKEVEKPKSILKRQTADKITVARGQKTIEIQYQKYNQDYDPDKAVPIIPLEETHQQISISKNIELPKQPQKEESSQPFISSEEDKSIRSDYSHWPIQPEMEEKILSVEKKAEEYLSAPKRPQYVVEPTEEIYEEESEQTMGEIVFEESEKMMPVEELIKIDPAKKMKDRRVNRRVINLAP